MDTAALIVGSSDVASLENVHMSPLFELTTVAREAAFLAKAAAKTGSLAKVEQVADLARELENAAKHTEFLARKIACRLNLPVQTSEPFLPTLKSETEGCMWMVGIERRRFCRFI